MKIITLLLLVLTFNFSFSQDTLFFTDGTSKKGKVTQINKSVVKFIAVGTEKAKRYTDKDVEKAIIFDDGKPVEYFYDKVPTLGTTLLTKISSGKANLYVTESYMYGNDYVEGGKEKHSFGGTILLYYAKRDSEDKYFDLNYDGAVVNKFKNRASKYLKDCQSLAQRIKNKEFGKLDVREIFEIYNNQCE